MLSCAVLSKTQQESINDLAIAGGDVTRAPSLVIETISDVRMERGLFYASTIKTEDIHIKELEAISEAKEDDMQIAKKFDAGIGFLNSYLFTLKSLSHENRWNDYGTEIRALGRTLG